MKTLYLASLALALLLVTAGINAQAQSISYVASDSTLQSISCNEKENTCQIAITVTFKKGTTLLAESVKAKDLKEAPVVFAVDGAEIIEIERTDGEYFMTTPTDSLASTRMSDIKKALTKALRGE